MFCKKCGKELENGLKFCTSCGAKIDPVKVPVNNVPPVQGQPQMNNVPPVQGQPPKKNGKKWIPFVVIGAVLFIVAVVCVGLFVIKPHLKKKDVAKVEDEQQIDFDEIIEKTMGINKMSKEKFDLSYYKGSGEDEYKLTCPDEYGYINYLYQDFDGDEKEEILVVSMEAKNDEVYLCLTMLEKEEKEEWKVADRFDEYDGEYIAGTISYFCPERCDVYTGEVDGQTVIYVEGEKCASYFSDGVRVSLYQLAYKDEKLSFNIEPLHMSGSDVDDFLTLDREMAELKEDLDYFETFEKNFKEYGLKLTEGMYYETPLYSQNKDLTYVAGYNKYANFTASDIYKWTCEGADGKFDGVVLEVSGTYKESYIEKETKPETAVSDDEWKKAYYQYLLGMDLSNYDGFSLVYVNDDEIPELYLFGNCEAVGQVFATYAGGQVKELFLGRLYSTYSERGNLIISSDGHMGYFYDIVYAIENGDFVELHNGEYYEVTDSAGNPVFDSAGSCLLTYSWDGQTVSVQEYENLLKEAIGGKYTENTPIQFTASGDMLNYLQNGEMPSVDNTSTEYIFPESSTGFLTDAQVAALTPEELRIARNEIYARHGYIFNKEDLKNYFESKSWYSGTRTEMVSDTELNEFELANRDLIAKYENP